MSTTDQRENGDRTPPITEPLPAMSGTRAIDDTTTDPSKEDTMADTTDTTNPTDDTTTDPGADVFGDPRVITRGRADDTGDGDTPTTPPSGGGDGGGDEPPLDTSFRRFGGGGGDIPWWAIALVVLVLAGLIGVVYYLFGGGDVDSVDVVEGSGQVATSVDTIDRFADQLGEHEDRISVTEDRIADQDGRITAISNRTGNGGRIEIPVCDVEQRFGALDAGLQDFWSDHGPDAPGSCLGYEVGTDARTACSSYAAWYQFAVSCRSDRASAYADRVIEREGLN